MVPQVSKIVFIEEAFVAAAENVGAISLARRVGQADATDAAETPVCATDVDAMPVGVIPAHDALQGRLEVGDGAITADQRPAPEQRWDRTQPDVERRDVSSGGRLNHGLARFPRGTGICRPLDRMQPPLGDGLGRILASG